MSTETVERDPIMASEGEVDAIRRLGQALAQPAERDGQVPPQLVTTNGETLNVPPSVYRALRQMLPVMARGDAVAVVPLHKEMTTQEAADFLNISRPSVVKLLEEGIIPHTKVGTHRRVRFSDVLTYKQRRSEERQRFLQYMLDVAQENNAYD